MRILAMLLHANVLTVCLVVQVISCVGIFTANAQNKFQQLLSSDKGLSSTLIGDIMQDSKGNLWIVTENGLNKYDGVKLRSYYHDPSDPHSLSSNYIRDVFEDRDGNLYVGTYLGIQIYDPATDSFSEISTFDDGVKFTHLINNFIQRENGDVLISGNILGKVTIAEDGHPVVSSIDAPIPMTSIEKVFEDSKGRLWVSNEASGVFRLDPDESVHRYLSSTSQNIFCICFCEDSKGNILIGTSRDGVWIYDPQADEIVPLDNKKYIARAFLINNNTETLICTDGKGLKCFNNETREITDYHFEVDFVEASKAKIHSATKDSFGNLWLAIYQHGAYMVPSQESPFHNFGYNFNDIIGRCCITAVIHTDDGQLFIGTDNDGIYIIDKEHKTSKHLSPDDYPDIPPIVIGLCEDSDGYIWIGSYGSGATRLNKKTLKSSKVEGIFDNNNEPVSNVYDFVEDNQKRVWIATMGGGLQCYNMKTGAIINCVEVNSTVNNWIGCIHYSEKTNSLLLGTYAGLWKIGLNDPGNEKKEILSKSIIHDIHEAKDGAIWAATSDGLVRWGGNIRGMEGEEVILITREQGLPSNICYSIAEDQYDRLWIGTGNGLIRLHQETLKQIHFYVEDGIQGNEFSKNACAVNPDNGDMYFGGINGISWFNPSDVVSKSHKWKVHISDMYIAGKPITTNSRSGGRKIIDRPVFEADHFSLDHSDNAFTLAIATDDLSNSDKKIIYYSFDEKEWIALPKGLNTVSFGNLPPGSYVFRTKVTDGSTESDVKTIRIYIRPAWWQSWWAILMLLLVISAIVYYIVNQIRHRRILRHKMFKHIQSERISESKLQFLTNVSHELRTPMTLIINPLQQLISSDNDASRQVSYKLMQRNAYRIMSLINQLMDARKIDNGQLKLKMKETEMCSYIESLTDNFCDVTRSRNISLSFHSIGLETLNVWIDEEQFDKVLMNLLSNAVKYTPSGGKIDISLAKIEHTGDNMGKAAEIVVTDTGTGIPGDDLDKVFRRFFQAKNKKSGIGTGVGLHLTRSIVLLHHGTIKAENNPGNAPGCRFTVRIPLGNAHLKKEEMAENNMAASESLTSNMIKDEITLLESGIKTDTVDTIGITTDEPDRKKVILVVEDDDEIRAYLRNQLNGKYKIYTCANGVQALDFVMKKAPNLIISDVMMPEMDGFALCKKIRQNIQFNDIPIILLTAKTMNEDYIHGLEIGADAYITKPFDIRVLKQTTASLLKSRQTLKNIYSGSQQQEGKIDDIEAKTPDEKLLEKVMNYINNNISNPSLSVELIASEVGLSRVHLHRKLRQLTNQTTRDLIRNQRIQLAARLLKEKNLPVSEVAYTVGFSSPAHFTTAFKSMFGVSPSQYSNQGK